MLLPLPKYNTSTGAGIPVSSIRPFVFVADTRPYRIASMGTVVGVMDAAGTSKSATPSATNTVPSWRSGEKSEI